MREMVCEICGSGSRPHLIANCTQCDAYEHCYCMPVVDFAIPHEWQCYECQEKANGGPTRRQGGQTELQRPLHFGGLTKEMETPKLDLSPKTSKNFGSAKVKFNSCEEAVLLSRERPHARSEFSMRQSQVRPASPPNVKHSSSMKCIAPNRSDTQVQALKRCAAASHDQAKIKDRADFAIRQSHVRPASPPNVKHPSNMKCISPSRSDIQGQALKRGAATNLNQVSIEDRLNFAMRQHQVPPASPPNVRSDTQVHALRRSAAASHDQAQLEDINMNREARSGGSMPGIHRCSTGEAVNVEVDSQIEDKTRENKIVNADNGKINSQCQVKPREKGILCASDYGTGRKSQMESLNHNIGVLITISSSAEYSRRPPPLICWTGGFLVCDAGTKHNLGEFKAQFPSKVSSKVYDIVKMMPDNLQLELLPRMNDWPKLFETSRPFHEDIALFFFSNEHDGHEKKHSYILEARTNYVLRAYIDHIKLLIYSSEVLPPDSHWIDGESYLWGIFVRSKGKRGPRPFGSTST
uniref:AIPP2-like SPOC-like domain-containing protein n=1 Tax=Arundo donax TaxID=35708 RepID=A0A0A8YNM0_ARUDO